jgi:site-specific DNA recombinase
MNTSIKYFIYARKSTDDPKRQIRSIGDQLIELRQLSKQHGCDVIEELFEHRSAKHPGRPVFNEMLRRIEAGEANGILAWNPDRLARNMLDGGRIIHLLDQDKLRDLKFPTYWFENTPQGKFTLAIGFSQGKYYVDSMGENIERGLTNKAKSGIWPQRAPVGYLNDPASRTIIVDPEKAPLVIMAFELYATGDYTLARLQQKINSLGLTGRNISPLSISNYQLLLTNPFYYGIFRFCGETYEGKHEPLIDKKLFDQVQAVMAAKSKPKNPGLKPFLYRGVFRCGECGCFITTELQKGHHYLRCTKRVKKDCSQGYIREERITEQIAVLIASVGIQASDAEWMIEQLEAERATDTHAWQESSATLRTRLNVLEDKLKRLLEGYLAQAISLDEYRAAKTELLGEKQQLKADLAKTEKHHSGWFEPAIQFVKALKEAGLLTTDGTEEQKRDFLKKIGSNPTITEKQIGLMPKEKWKLVVDQGHFVQHNAAPVPGAPSCIGENHLSLNKSGRQDSNLRPLDPQIAYSRQRKFAMQP